MTTKPKGIITKLILILVFFMGLCMMCNLMFAFEETEMIEGIVEHTYTSKAHNGRRGGLVGSVPMCRVVWYDKDGEQVVYGMPNQDGYEVGDSYYLEVDVETNRIPKRSVGECVVAFVFGLIVCVSCVLIWRNRFKKHKHKHKPAQQLSALEQMRKEAYDLQKYTPVVRCSICNGEQVAGFKDKQTGKFTEVMLIRGDKDLEEFKKRYGVDKITKEY